jgi:hypothetical protein
VEILGDCWSLLIIRDVMLRNFRTYKEFLESYERIATNILADRLRRLEAHGIITVDLWAAGHEDTGNQALVQQIQKNKEQFLRSVRERWAGK